MDFGNYIISKFVLHCLLVKRTLWFLFAIILMFNKNPNCLIVMSQLPNDIVLIMNFYGIIDHK